MICVEDTQCAFVEVRSSFAKATEDTFLSAPERKVAEGEGFEPPEPCGSAVFKTAAIDHSATLPER